MKDFKSIDEALQYLYDAESDLLDALIFGDGSSEELHLIVGSLITISSQIVSLRILSGGFW